MKKANLFYQYYDILYSSKSYREEIETILSIAAKHYPQSLKKILEIGCGTGSHTKELAQRSGAKIVAIDTDQFMVELATAKVMNKNTENIQILRCAIEQMEETDFNMAIAAFNVITYIPDMNSLQSFFDKLYQSLKLGGLFIFDCWNGIAAIKDPPQSKNFNKIAEGKNILCKVISRTDFFNQKTALEYKIQINDINGNIIESEDFSFEQTLWTPMQIEYCLKESGLEVIQCCKSFEPTTKASDKDWKIMYICKKI